MLITRTTCRVCDGSLEPILSLGEQYVSNFLDPHESDGEKSPLELVLCVKCHLLQLKHTVPAGNLYQNYWYQSGTNQTMRDALADIAHTAEHLIHLKEGDVVLDIGCNDGTLLASYKTGNITKIGVDPAENIVIKARNVADIIKNDFFSSELFEQDSKLSALHPNIVTSIAMFYDLEDPKKFVADVKSVMDPNGLWIIQMSYLPLMLKTHELGNICHEHLEYYSLQSLEYLLDMFDFEVVDAALNDINGGSIRVYVRLRTADKAVFGDSTYRELAMDRVQELRDHELQMRLNNIEPYREFAVWCERIRNDVVNFIKEQSARGKKIYVYGASTKGNTVLQYYELDDSLIGAAVERNSQKWGKMTVGTHIPIISEEDGRTAKPDYFLVLPWHFLEEFKFREKDYLLNGGRFIMPAPYFSLI